MNKLMEKLEAFLDKYLMPVADVINRNVVISGIKDGMMSTLPPTMIASIALILSNFPYLDKLSPPLHKMFQTFFAPINSATLGIIALYALVGTAYYYSKGRKIDKLYGIMTAVASFLIVTPFQKSTEVTVGGEKIATVVSNVIDTGAIGATGIFPALIVAIISISIYAWFEHKNITIKMPASVPPNVVKPFVAIIPMGVTVMIFMGIRLLFQATPYGTLAGCINTFITTPFLNLTNNIWVFMFLIFIAQILWFFGLHGTNLIITPIWQPAALVAMAMNLEAYNAGLALPFLMTAAFRVYTNHCKLSEIMALVLLGKSKRSKAISKTIFLPALFNIHEPFVFGLPAVMNPTIFIPWIISEPLQAGLAYLLMKLTGAIPIYDVPWTTPPILKQLISTNFNPWAIVITLSTFALGFIIWVPFIKMLDNQFLREEAEQEKNAEQS